MAVLILGGIAAAVLAMVAGALPSARVAAASVRNDASRARPSLASRLAARGLPAPAVVGVRFALEPGRGRAAVPVRAAIATAAAVSTYIQSGNVLLESDARPDSLENELEAMLERRFRFPQVVVVRSHRQLRNIVDNAPEGFGAEPGTYHSEVLFLKSHLSSRQAMRVVELREGVDQAWPGSGVLYFARVSARRAQSRMSRIVGTPEYQQMTIRSWTTTTKLLGRLETPGRPKF